VFSKFVKLYRLKAATTKACLNKILNDDMVNVTRPKCNLGDKGTQFASKNWKNNLADMKIGVFSHPYVTRKPNKRKMYEGYW